MKASNVQVRGVRYELQVAAHFARDQGTKNIQFVRKYLGKWGTRGTTDLDLLVDGIAYEVKSSAAALSKLSAPKLRDFVSYLLKENPPLKKMFIVIPPGTPEKKILTETLNKIMDDVKGFFGGWKNIAID